MNDVREALDGGALPFLADPVPKQPAAGARFVASLLSDISEPISDLAQAEIAAALADILRSLGGQGESRPAPVDVKAAELARDYLAAHAREQIPASTLEQITGSDRFTLARHFGRAYGTSPDRYRTLRRLAFARALGLCLIMREGCAVLHVGQRLGDFVRVDSGSDVRQLA